MAPTTDPNTLLRALDRWDILWQAAMEKLDVNRRSWLGVSVYASELSVLSRRIIQANMTADTKKSRYLRRIVGYDFADLHEFIRQYSEPKESPTGVFVASAEAPVSWNNP
jgi:hypothetical protein